MSQRFFIILLTILLLGSLIANALLYQMLEREGDSLAVVEQQIIDLKAKLEKQPEKTIEDVPKNQGSISGPIKTGDRMEVQVKKVVMGDVTATFTHYCDGSMLPTIEIGGIIHDYCVGTNWLEYSDTKGNKKEIARSAVLKDADAPLFQKAFLVPSTASQKTVLLSYGPNTCFTDNQDVCEFNGGFGAQINYAVQMGSEIVVRELFAAPFSDPEHWVWNKAGTKAIIIPLTCSGGGCTTEPLIGYDLLKDEHVYTSTEKAAGAGKPLDTTSYGDVYNKDGDDKPLPFWQKVTWKNNSEFTATIMVPPYGNPLDITGKF